jgi:hypothetical protein
MTTWTKKSVVGSTWAQDTVAAKSWTKDSPNSSTWDTANLILYLLMEDNDPLLQEDGELIIIDRPQIRDWTQDIIGLSSWTKKTIQ